MNVSRIAMNLLALGVLTRREFWKAVALLLLTLQFAGCNSEAALQKTDVNVTTVIDNLVVAIGSNVTIENQTYQLSSTFCPESLKPRLKAGNTAVQVGDSLSNLRKQPGTRGTILHQIGRGERVSVIAGPICVEGFNWYIVADESYQVGWVAEGNKVTGAYLFEALNGDAN